MRASLMLKTDVLITPGSRPAAAPESEENPTMPKRGELTISKRTVDGLSVEGKDAVLACPILLRNPVFGLTVRHGNEPWRIDRDDGFWIDRGRRRWG